jgi:hypothetical protein
MKNKVEKYESIKAELIVLIDRHGYWSEEVLDFNSNLDYDTMMRVNNEIKSQLK